MAHKISKIFNSKNHSIERKTMNFQKTLEKSKIKSEKEKWKIFKIAEDNQLLLKRLHEAQTSYNNKKYENDYQKSLYYKSNICEYTNLPKITLIQLEQNKFSNTHSKGFSQSKTSFKNITVKERLEKTSSKFFEKTKKENEEKPNFNAKQTALFYRSCFFQDLFYCMFKFYIEDKKMVISVEPKESKDIVYFMIFEGLSEIMKMKTLYSNYEDIIDNIDHNLSLDLVFLKNSKVKIAYYTIKVDKYKTEPSVDSIIESFAKGVSKGKRIELENVEFEKKKAEFEKEINSDDKEQLQLNNLVGYEEKDISSN